jgi:DNA polymerase
MPDRAALLELLHWYLDAGADEAIADMPLDRLAAVAQAPQPAQVRRTPVAAQMAVPAAGPALDAKALAAATRNLNELEAAVRGFDGCALKKTAMNTVFADGVPGAGLVIVGEAPGADEDRIGRPFVGRSGQLLDRMLAAIGIDRTGCYIMNTLYWRPPGNRTPTADEVAACLPFVLRQIALARPKVLVLCGNAALQALLGKTGITRLRGRWQELVIPDLEGPVPTLPTFHPSYLLRSPVAKKQAWRDFLALQSKLQETH